MRRVVAAVSATAMMVFGTSAAFAGEITGNGQLKTVHGNSPCAFSGQEDLQWFTDDSDQTRLTDPVKGVPKHSQNWGHTDGRANEPPPLGLEWGRTAHEFGLKP